MAKLFIDKSTATWGLAEDIVFLDIDPERLESVSDSQIVYIAETEGMTPFLPSF